MSLYPEFLDYEKVKNLLIQKLLGIQFELENALYEGAKSQFVTVYLKLPGDEFLIPVSVYIPEKKISRNRFFTICNRLQLDIKDFDNQCGFKRKTNLPQ
ncbi:hypothetical protein [Leptospira jelokensis]|uniref:Uncharacterized protein n=1 Tax=Leptospira jelokensis TaxID=2484931 RepID=A0A4Z1A2R2_9LEPT|nr:hypothetical protein [Leptospira jelokensis]TGL58583.1 hypothetical protein EHQ62_16940 [Leptospira jelokensis]